MKERYLQLIRLAVDAYTEDHIAQYTREVREGGLREHGYPRLTANIGMLVAHGQYPERREMFREMMELCCREMLTSRARTKSAGNDFSVKELVFCLEEVEKAGVFEKSVTDGWREILAQIDPCQVYSVIAPKPVERIGNWAAFGAASEQARKAAGIGDESEFIENQMLSQLLSFDENGMYRDPHEPMVYDAVTRLQLALCLDCGYDGAGRDELEEYLDRSAVPTLLMQSVTGEIPFGGRSNQFLHNETFWAALCEFYAARYARRGEMRLAGQFKSAARYAVDSLDRWLEMKPVHHIKNRFPLDSRIGCEGYGYFNKYMVTMGSWACMAYRLANDSIPEIPCPAQTGGVFWQTGDSFHKVFLSAGGYFAQYDTAADPHYDSSGLGRIQKKDAPPAICLSVPFPTEPNYTVGMENPAPFAISAGAKTDGEWCFASDVKTEYAVRRKSASAERTEAEFSCRLTDGTEILHTCTVDETGVALTVSGAAVVGLELPVFVTDGDTETEIEAGPQSVTVHYQGWKTVYAADGILTDTGVLFGNRNGRYRRFTAEKEDALTVHIAIEKE